MRRRQTSCTTGGFDERGLAAEQVAIAKLEKNCELPQNTVLPNNCFCAS